MHLAKITERSIRLSTGLILFTYATTHLINHSVGMISVDAMQSASKVLIDPWRSYPGLIALYGSFIVHGFLGLYALYRRRHVRIARAELWQLISGLTIPVLLISHATAARLSGDFNGVDLDYQHFLLKFFVVAPLALLPRQFLLLFTVWIHGCIGLRTWIRTKVWYGQAAPLLLAAASLIPMFAILGVMKAGLEVRDAAERDPSLLESLANTAHVNPYPVSLDQVVLGLTLSYVALLTFVLAARFGRSWYTKRFSPVRITYPGGMTVSVASGFSVLEASQWAGFLHESVCGGRGRCSTCRVRVIDGIEGLPPPGVAERSTLKRINAPFDVRLACQIRPARSITVQPLVSPRIFDDSSASRFGAAIGGGTEREVAAMFVDLRQSTQLASGRLPFDTLFLFDRYIQAVTIPVNNACGHVTSIAGDGVMSTFGLSPRPRQNPARDALTAALAIWEGLEKLNAELSSELTAPLRIGIGIHFGVSIVGWINDDSASTLQFLGETGNIAAKLEEQTKSLGCTLAVSSSATTAAGLKASDVNVTKVSITGKADRLAVSTFRDKTELVALLAGINNFKDDVIHLADAAR